MTVIDHFSSPPENKKSAPTEVSAQKTQTPIVAKLTDIRACLIHSGTCVFIKFIVHEQKGDTSPSAGSNCRIQLVWRSHYTILIIKMQAGFHDFGHFLAEATIQTATSMWNLQWRI